MGAVQRRNKLVDDIQRLREMDSALRGDGVNVPEFAERWQTAKRTIHRYLDALRELVGATEAERADDLHFRHRYAGKAVKLFASSKGA